MPCWKDGMIQRVLQQRMLRRWQCLAEASATADLETLRTWRTQARSMRRQLDRVLHQAEHRAMAEQPGAAEHAAQGEAAERRQVFAQQFGEAGAGGHCLIA